MARKDYFTNTTMHCTVCTNPIPPERRKDSVTCSPECTKTRNNWNRSKADAVSCRYCLKPSTPEERERYQRWSRWDKTGVTEEQSAAALLREVQRLKAKIAKLEQGG